MLRTDLELEHLKESKKRLDTVLKEIKEKQCEIFFQEKHKEKLVFMEHELKISLNVLEICTRLEKMYTELTVLECEKRWWERVLGIIEEKPEFWIGDLWK